MDPWPKDGSCPDELIAFADLLADVAGRTARRYFRTRLDVDSKADDTPVTSADREAEEAMRAAIEQAWPEHGIIGEEHGGVREDARLVWVLDPIDGTKAFIAGKPTFGILIALLKDGVPILGVIDQPVLGERWIGAAGRATIFNGAPATTRSCATLDGAILNATSPDMFKDEDAVRFDRISAAVKLTLFGGDCYASGLLASGFIDLVVEADLKPYDYCALVPVIEGAGGVITDWQGAALTLESDGRVVTAGDPALHCLAVEALDAA